MADFKTHITTSTILGVAYGAGGYFFTDVPETTCMVGAGLCSIGGIMPDLDSDSGLPIREGFAFLAAVTPMLMLDRFRAMGFNTETMVLAAALIYIFVRFVVAEIFKRYTVHRGMWHSVPAAATVGLLAFLICSGDLEPRIYKASGVVLGFLCHLVLDEIWSVDWNGRRLKKSSGTALKFFSKKLWPNVSTYGKLAIVIVLVIYDPTVVLKRKEADIEAPLIARDLDDELEKNVAPLRR